jgi:hypothetical protein
MQHFVRTSNESRQQAGSYKSRVHSYFETHASLNVGAKILLSGYLGR